MAEHYEYRNTKNGCTITQTIKAAKAINAKRIARYGGIPEAKAAFGLLVRK